MYTEVVLVRVEVSTTLLVEVVPGVLDEPVRAPAEDAPGAGYDPPDAEAGKAGEEDEPLPAPALVELKGVDSGPGAVETDTEVEVAGLEADPEPGVDPDPGVEPVAGIEPVPGVEPVPGTDPETEAVIEVLRVTVEVQLLVVVVVK